MLKVSTCTLKADLKLEKHNHCAHSGLYVLEQSIFNVSQMTLSSGFNNKNGQDELVRIGYKKHTLTNSTLK